MMNTKRRLAVIALAAVLISAAACNQSSATPTAQSSPTSSPSATGNSGLTVAQLKNATYYFKDAPNGQISLRDGQGEEPSAPNSASQYTATFVGPVAFGNLNQDSAPDAAVTIVTSGGGSGSFFNLAVLLNENGQPKNVASQLLGDRIKIRALQIANNQITVEYLDRGPNDPLSAEPTQPRTRTFRLAGNQLVEVP